MKANFLRVALCCGMLGVGAVRAQDSNGTTTLPEAPAAPSTEVSSNHFDTFNRSVVLGLGNDVVLKKGETCPFVVAIGGDAKVDGVVDGIVVVINGNLTMNGEARQDTWVIGGSADVGPKAHALGDFVVLGGTLTRAEGAKFENLPQEIGPQLGGPIQSAWKWITHGLLLGRPVVPSLSLVWVIVGAFLALYLLIALLFRNAAATSVETIERHPIGSLLTGFLAMVLLATILSVLVVSVAGLFLLPFVLCGIFFAAVIGKVAVYEFIGSLFSSKLRPPGYASLLALTLGMAICVVLGMVPFIGFLVWGMIGLLGLGAVTLSCFRLLQREVVTTHSAFVAASAAPPAMASAPSPGAPAGAAAPIVATAAPPVINRQPLPFPLANFWPRAGALALDLIVVGGTLALVNALPLFPLGFLAYTVGFLVWRGATIGFMIAGLRCVRTNGGVVSWQYAVARTMASVLSLLPLGLGFLWAALDPNKQTWHDKIAGTVVVKIPPMIYR